MSQNEIYTPPTGPPQGPGPSRELYGIMGPENIYQMAEDFYGELEKSEIRHLFPEDMKTSSRKTGEFLMTLMGGPPVYVQKHGPPRMRARHLPFAIDENARQVWLRCFRHVLENNHERYAFPKQEIPAYMLFLEEFSAWMVNRKTD